MITRYASITVKFISATNTKPCRLKASYDGRSKIYSYNTSNSSTNDLWNTDEYATSRINCAIQFCKDYDLDWKLEGYSWIDNTTAVVLFN